MDDTSLGFALIGLMVTLIIIGLPIGITLISTGAIGVWLIRENPDLAFRFAAMATYSGIQDYLFATIPLFVLMGLLVSISDVGKDTFDVAQNLLKRIKGGLGIATVGANAVFAAVTGVSIASAAVFTKVAVPEMVRHGYSMRFAAGTVAGSSSWHADTAVTAHDRLWRIGRGFHRRHVHRGRHSGRDYRHQLRHHDLVLCAFRAPAHHERYHRPCDG